MKWSIALVCLAAGLVFAGCDAGERTETMAGPKG